MAHFLILSYIVLVYARLQEYIPFVRGEPVMQVFLIVSFIVWVALPNKRFEAPQYKLLPLFLLTMSASIFVNGWAGGALVPITEYGPSVILFFLLSTSVETVAQHARAIRVLAGLSTFLAVHGIEQYWTGIGWSGAELSQGTRITYLGIFNDPNDLALAFVLALPMLVYALSETKFIAIKAFWLASTLAVAYGIFLTNSRGGMLGLIALFLIYVWRRLGIVKATLAAELGIAGLTMLPTRLNELDAKEESAAERIESWYQGMQMLLQHPIFGVGKGNYSDHHYLTAHNSFVLVFAELGMVGYFLWLSFLGLSLYMVYRIARVPTEPTPPAPKDDKNGWVRYQKISRTYLLSMIGFIICAFFLSRSYVILLIILCALCVAVYQSVRRKWPTFAPITIRGALGGILAFQFGSILLIYLMVRILGG